MSDTSPSSAAAPNPGSTRQTFAARIRFAVAGAEDITQRFGAALRDHSMFIRHDAPPAVGDRVLISFIAQDGAESLGKIATQVVHSRRALQPGEGHAGMGLRFTGMDSAAKVHLQNALKAEMQPPLPLNAPVDKQAYTLDLGAYGARPLLAVAGPVLGIDLGTVNSCIALATGSAPQALSNRDGHETLPSIVFLPKQDEQGDDTACQDPIVGHRAFEKMILAPTQAIYGSKRFLGRPYASKEVRSMGHFFHYELVPGADGRTAARIGEQDFRLEEVAAMILRQLRETANASLQADITRAVITVPAYFGETQRQAIREAGHLAGFFVERIINEPTAAAVAYGFGRNIQKTVLVYDLGGGTFDASILKINGKEITVLATDGDPFLGGYDFDDRLTEYTLSVFERQTQLDLRGDPVAVQRVRTQVETAKRQLSEAEETVVEVPYVAQVDGQNHDLKVDLDRQAMESMTQDLVDRTLKIVELVMKQADLRTEDLDDVLLVGGQSRAPHVRSALVERFGRLPSKTVHPDHAVALGAAVVAEALHNNQPIELTDILPATLWLQLPNQGQVPVIERGSKLPATYNIRIPLSHGSQRKRTRIEIFRGNEDEEPSHRNRVGSLDMPHGLDSTQEGGAGLTITLNQEGLISAIGRDLQKPHAEELPVTLDGEHPPPLH